MTTKSSIRVKADVRRMEVLLPHEEALYRNPELLRNGYERARRSYRWAASRLFGVSPSSRARLAAARTRNSISFHAPRFSWAAGSCLLREER